jgi:starvation-inducible outer membrane lipoprotein
MDSPLTYSTTTQGRFIILAPGYIDKLVYKAGTGITVAGKVEGVEFVKIGELKYPYVLITPTEMKIFAKEDYQDRYDYPFRRAYPYYDAYGNPLNPYDTFFDPFFGPYYQGLPPYYYPPAFFPPGHHHHD